MPSVDDPWRGRHVVRLIGMESEGETLVFANSWGHRWGDAGVGYMTREYFNAYADHTHAAVSANFGLSPENFSVGLLHTEPNELAETWMQPRKRHVRSVTHRNIPHEIVTYRMVSLDWHCPVDVIEIWRNDRRWAWTHLAHRRPAAGGNSVIRELFVLPQLRRNGLGSLLELEACEAARAEGSSHITLEVHESEGSATLLGTAQAFAVYRGYRWTRSDDGKRPVVVGNGRKEL